MNTSYKTPIVTPSEWEAARQRLLVKEKELTRARDVMAAERRRMPWAAVETPYEFDGPSGRMHLADLFEGRRQLLLYRAFFEPGVHGWPDHACVGCSLMADQVAHLAHLHARDITFAFASRAPQPDIERVTARRRERVPVGVELLLQTINVPAFVVNKYRDVLAANRLAEALSPLMAPGVNRLIALFTDPAARDYHPDWEQGTAAIVAQLCAEAGADTDDPRLSALVGELSLKSERFRKLWARHDVRQGHSATSVIHHPRVGDLQLRREKPAHHRNRRADPHRLPRRPGQPLSRRPGTARLAHRTLSPGHCRSGLPRGARPLPGLTAARLSASLHKCRACRQAVSQSAPSPPLSRGPPRRWQRDQPSASPPGAPVSKMGHPISVRQAAGSGVSVGPVR
jgi:hypothetical protein